MSNIRRPLATLATCFYCHSDLDITDKEIYQLVKGWVPVREYGGNRKHTNRVTLPVWMHSYSCRECIEKLSDGLPYGQMNIFESTDE